MKEFLSFYSTNSLSRSNLNYENGNIKNIHYGDIHTKFPSILNCEDEEIPYINLDVDMSKIKEENYCKDADLVIADASEDYNDIGKAIELRNVGNQKIVAGLHTHGPRGAAADGRRDRGRCSADGQNDQFPVQEVLHHGLSCNYRHCHCIHTSDYSAGICRMAADPAQRALLCRRFLRRAENGAVRPEDPVIPTRQGKAAGFVQSVDVCRETTGEFGCFAIRF